MSALFSVDLMNQLAVALEGAGFSPEDVARLRAFPNLQGIKSVILAHAQIVPVEHLIDCSVDPHEPKGLSVHEHKRFGMLKWDPAQVTLYLSQGQRHGKRIKGTELQRELQGKLVMNANVLDSLLAHPEFIPESWKGKAVFFWGTIYRGLGDDLCVRCLCWSGSGWYSHHGWLGRGWGDLGPAALLA